MKLTNKAYDILKYVALTVLPAVATLILALGTIWGLPYSEAIAATVTAVDTFLGALLGVSTQAYKKAQEGANNEQ